MFRDAIQIIMEVKMDETLRRERFERANEPNGTLETTATAIREGRQNADGRGGNPGPTSSKWPICAQNHRKV